MHFIISFLAGVVLFYSFHYFPFSTVFISLISSVYLTLKKKIFFIFILLSGILYAFLRYEPSQDILFIKDPVAVRGVFGSYPVKTERGTFKQILKIKSAIDIKSNERLKELCNKEIVLFSDKEFDPESEYELAVKFSKSRKRFNPGQQMNNEIYAILSDVYGSGNKNISLNVKIQEYRYRINRYIEENFGKDSGTFVASITTGQKTHMDEKMKDAFNVTGLAHILSISGTHFGLFSVLLFSIFRFSIKALPYRILQRMTIYLTPSQAAAIFCFPFMLAYLGLSGASIPAIRSFIMITLFLVGLIIGRKGFWLNSLLFAAFVLTIWEPEVILNLSFQLSFLAVLFIGFAIGNKDNENNPPSPPFSKGGKGGFSGEKTEDEKKEDRKVFRYLKNALLITLSASIGTAPLVAYYFHYFSIISPISNLFVAPLIGFILIPLSVFSSFLFLVTGHFVLTPIVSAVADISIFLVKLLSYIPFADVKIPAFPPILLILFYGGFIFYFLSPENTFPPSPSPPPLEGGGWGRGNLHSSLYQLICRNVSLRKRYTLLIPFVPILIYFSLTIFEKKDLTVTFLDVGQGDSSVIELPDRKTMVIDTGKTGRETSSFLKYRGKNTIDYIVLSHIHPDHTGGLDYVIKNFDVKEIWDNDRTILPDAFNHIKQRSLHRGDMIEGKGYRIYILHPYPEFYTMNRNEYVSANNDSLVLKIEGNHGSFLFAGDVEEEAEENIMHLGKWLKSNVMKVPHHGGKTSAYGPFSITVSPDIAVISLERDNPFDHPHQETLDILQGVKIFRTDIDGAIKIKETLNSLEVKTYKGFQFIRARSLSDEIKNIKRLVETW